MRCVIFILFLLISRSFVHGQIPVYKKYTRQFTSNNGLPDNTVTGIAQDSLDYLWIGTKQGLCYYDGNEFRQMKSKQADIQIINSNDIHFLQICGQKLLITTVGKTFVIDTKSKTLDTSFNWLKDDYVCSMQKIGNDIWVGTKTDLLKFNLQLKLKKRYKCIKAINHGEGIVNIHAINKNQLLLHFYLNTFYDFDILSETFQRNKRLAYHSKEGCQPLRSYYDPASKNLYVSVWGQGTFVSQVKNPTDTGKLANPRIFSAWFYASQFIGNRLFLCCNNGVFTFNPTTQKIIQYQYFTIDNKAIEINDFHAIYKDRSKNIWIATDNGLLKYNEQEEEVKNISNGIDLFNPKSEIYDFYIHADSILFIAAYGEGLIKINLNNSIKKTYLHKEMPSIWSISKFKSKNKLRLAGHKNYVMDFDLISNEVNEVFEVTKYVDSANLFTFFYQDQHGRDWYSINNKGGILMYDAIKNKFQRFRKNDSQKTFALNYANRVAEDDEGNLWFSTNKNSNFVEFNHVQNKFIEHSLLDPFGKIKIYHGLNNILPDRKEMLICGDGDGLIIYDPKSKTSKIINTNSGLASNFVFTCVLDMKKRIWVGTSKGLSCIIRNDKDYTIKNFGIDDGFSENQFGLQSVYNPKKNAITIASMYQVYQFNPDSLLANAQTYITPLVEEIYVNGVNAINSEIKLQNLNYQQNAISILFGAVDYVNGSNLQFQAKLSGKDTNWIDLQKSRSINYTNLKPNDYTVFARVKQIGSEWNYLSTPIKFTITAPFWQRWWFILALTIIGSMVLFLSIRYYYRRATIKELEKLKQQRVIEDERARIAADMHDDLGSGLMQIKYIAEDIIESSEKDQKENLSKLGKKANELTESMGEIIWSMRDKSNTIEDLFYYMRSQFLQYSEDQHLICKFELPEQMPNTIISGAARRHIYLICKECFHNIVKHAKATRVTFVISVGKKLVIQIKDNGKGFNVNEKYNGNGIINLKKRADALHGELLFTSNKFGTVIDLTVDLNTISIKNLNLQA